MGMEFKEQKNLSEQQEEMLHALGQELLPLIVQLKNTNDSNISEQIMEGIKQFKEDLKKEDIDISDEQINAYINDLYSAQEAA